MLHHVSIFAQRASEQAYDIEVKIFCMHETIYSARFLQPKQSRVRAHWPY